MSDKETGETSPMTARPSRRPPWTVIVPVVFAYVIGAGALLAAYDRIREDGAFSSPGFLFTSVAIDVGLGVLLIWGAHRASTGVTNVVLTVALLGTGAVLVVTNLSRGWGVVEVLVGLALPALMLVILLRTRSSRAYFRVGDRPRPGR
jgi:hypothetical protein